MKKPLFTALSPNAQKDDIWLAFKLIWQPWRWRKGPALEKLTKAFEEYLPIPSIFLFESGRTALYTLFWVLNLQRDDEILLQAYTCVAVPEPVLWIFGKPIYVDIDAKTLTMSPADLEKKITARSKVLIIQHTFGQPANLTELLAIAKKHGLFVVEDCAHSLGSSYNGQKVGTFGDASFYSFGRDKVISSVFGGALAVKNPELSAKVAEFKKNYVYPKRRWILQQLLHPIILGMAKATYRWYLGKVILKIARRLNLLSKAVYPQEREGRKPPFLMKKLPNALAVLALHQFQKLETTQRHRHDIAKLYEEGLEKLPIVLPPKLSQEPGRSIYLRYTVQTLDAAQILKTAKAQEIHLGDWYTTAIAPEGVNYEKILYNPTTCPIAEKVAPQSFNLPTDPHITPEDAQTLIQFLKNFYGTTTTPDRG